MYHRRRKSAQRSINRNIVECKVYLHASVRHPAHVLIETSWNEKPNWWYYIIIKGSTNRNIVECKVWNCSSGSSSVLIETSWNVKRYVAVIVAEPVFCINRNIVECKVHITKGQVSACPVLIETSWNVKLYTTFYIVSIHRINRNIVECKDAISINFMHLIICINRSIVECKGTTLDLL